MSSLGENGGLFRTFGKNTMTPIFLWETFFSQNHPGVWGYVCFRKRGCMVVAIRHLIWTRISFVV